jgi:hypothetical protein
MHATLENSGSVNVLAQSCILVSLHIGLWTPYKFDREVTDKTTESEGAQSGAIRVNKKLFPKGNSYDKLSAVAGKARLRFIELTLPWLNDGTRILPTKSHNKFKAEMHSVEMEFAAALETFLLDYPAIKDSAKVFLNGLYRESDFPGVAKLRSRFSFSAKVFPIPDANDFRADLDIDGSQMAAIKEDLENNLKTALNDAMQHTFHQVSDAVRKMAEKLRGYSPAEYEVKPMGTFKNGRDRLPEKTLTKEASGTFKDSLVENMRELATSLRDFNLSNDANFNAIIDRISNELCAEDASDLRKDEVTRINVAESAESILADVESLFA